MGLFSFLTKEIAIDLGTANTIIIHNDKIVVDEPSIVAVDQLTGKLIAIGNQARQMHGKTHVNIRITGDAFTADIQAYMRHQHNIKVGERTAEDIKINVGSCLPELESPPED